MPEETRQIVVVRHAKAEHPDAVDDRDRPLAERGRKDAKAAGRWLTGAGVDADLALVSPAVRTRDTWELMVPELRNKPRTVQDKRLYDASLGALITVLNEQSDEDRDVVVVGHNPGVRELAEALAGEAKGDVMARMKDSGFPTAAAAILAFEGSWAAVEHNTCRLTAFWAPHA
ncbi:SixA phosphatase family protein [Kitasatospora sp. NPDC048298]|uniref:SixA phosphatase family protein n=1 Tax=Kitasatospora sp. NPDC048298 TaxID=3364049 RepID=UPI00371249AA